MVAVLLTLKSWMDIAIWLTVDCQNSVLHLPHSSDSNTFRLILPVFYLFFVKAKVQQCHAVKLHSHQCCFNVNVEYRCDQNSSSAIWESSMVRLEFKGLYFGIEDTSRQPIRNLALTCDALMTSSVSGVQNQRIGVSDRSHPDVYNAFSHLDPYNDKKKSSNIILVFFFIQCFHVGMRRKTFDSNSFHILLEQQVYEHSLNKRRATNLTKREGSDLNLMCESCSLWTQH